MIWAQGSLCLVLWIAFGYWSSRKAWSADLPKKPWSGIGLMVLGAVVMFTGMAALVSMGGMRNGVLTPMGWIGSGFFGLIFIGAQSYGSVWVMRSVVGVETRDNKDTSKKQDLEK